MGYDDPYAGLQFQPNGLVDMVGGHTLITLERMGTQLDRKFGQNVNLVNRAYLVNMLTMLLSQSKTCQRN